MRESRYVSFTLNRCSPMVHDDFTRAQEALEEVRERHKEAASEADWPWWLVCLLLVLGSALAPVLIGPLDMVLAWLGAGMMVFALSLLRTGVWLTLRHSLLAAVWGIVWAGHRLQAGIRAMEWGATVQEEGTDIVVPSLIRHMLGEDPDSLFIPGSYEGLKAPRDPDYVVKTRASERLQRKLTHIQDGTIAVCGPRGAGKTTLLQRCVGRAGFGVIAQAPATYAPHDFVLSLSIRLCETYIRENGYEVPGFARLSPLRRLLRQVKAGAIRLGRWGAFALPATLLIGLGLSAPVRSLYSRYATSLADTGRDQAQMAEEHIRDLWQGHAVAASVLVTITGIIWWKSRHQPRLLGLAARVFTKLCPLAGALLVIGSVGSVLFDDQLHELGGNVSGRTALAVLVLFVLWVTWWALREIGEEFPLGQWHVNPAKISSFSAVAGGLYFVLNLVPNPQIYALLADEDNPLRLVGVVGGALVWKASFLRPRQTRPDLVERCRDHLYRLQTIQMSTNALNTGAAQVLTLGSSHTTSISTVPPNFPELVDTFRALLTDIAWRYVLLHGKTVVIAIDEVDRLGSDTQALAFLSEIKAILGVPYVYYLISVAEDVGATFVRRGLPHRDATDSSLDDILHVPPTTLQEAYDILAKRAETLTQPYAVLAHALSGGILRDLLRYGLQIREIQDKTDSLEMTDISRHLLLEELSETLAGFRTLLSKLPLSRADCGILTVLRTLGSHLEAPCPCTDNNLRTLVEHFAFYATDSHLSPASHESLPGNARLLIDEASAYTYFSLTLLDIFGTRGLVRRTEQAAQHGPDGALHRLAEARQELGVSPYSARPLIDSIRKAWSLPQNPTTIHDPEAGELSCPAHRLPFLFPPPSPEPEQNPWDLST
ncbi:hypothetical protein GCM10010245_81010 [Streptomyces spectabilis]|nr:hypothetical protein GCM10010245_81010 [Streptomyces spectabilis]